MKVERLLSMLVFAALLPLTSMAATWQDPVTKVKYKYTVGQTTASVTKSSDATGDITILSTITVDGNDYNVTSIGTSAFEYCNGLTGITIPATLNTIGEDAFSYCKNLVSFTIEPGENKLKLNGPIDLYSGTDSGYALSVGRNLTLSSNWSGSGFFPSATSAELGGNMTTVNSYLFSDATKLASVTIGNGITSIGEHSFESSGLTSVTIPSNVTSIGEDAFDWCSGLTSFTIEPGENKLKLNGPINSGSYALSVGRNLTLSSNWSGWGFFPSATSAELGGNMTTVNSYLFDGAGKLASVTIGSGITSIGEYSFANSGLTSVTIPSNVTSIGEEAFASCQSLTEAVFSEGITKIGGFSDCTKLASVTIPSTVTTIKDDAFNGCTGLTSFTIPATVNTIGDGAFDWCSGLTSFIIEPGENKLTLNGEIGTNSGYALFVGRNLTLLNNDFNIFFYGAASAELGGNMTTVNSYLFYGATMLASVTFGSSVTSIGQEAFHNCPSLTSVKMHHLTPFTCRKDAFTDDTYTNATLLVPADTKPIYAATNHWKDFTHVDHWSTLVTLTSSAHGALTTAQATATNGSVQFRQPKEDAIVYKVTADRGYELTVMTDNGADVSPLPALNEEQSRANTDGEEYVTMEATFTPIIYTLTYNLAGGTVATANPETYTVESETFTLTNPTRVGYNFAGWTGADLTEPTQTVTIAQGSIDNREYTAVWTPIVYSITYTLNGGTVATENPKTYTIESETFTLTNPTRVGYTFDGWTGTGLTEPTQTVTIALGSIGNREYTAVWTPIVYTLSYNLAGGALAEGETNPTEYTIESDNITLKNPTREGYNFVGWTGTELTEAAQTVTIAKGSIGNREYTAVWTPVVYAITYDLAGGALAEGETNPAEYTIESDIITLKNPTRKGYTFAGWTGTDLTEAAQAVTIAKGSMGNRSYTATWTLITFTITYDLAGGTLAEGETNPAEYTVESETFTLKNPTREGYTFAGWTGTDLTGPTQTMTIAQGSIDNRAYTAVWTPIVYSIAYTLDGGTVATENPSTYTIESETFTLTNPTKTGYTFTGWTGTDLTENTQTVTIAKGSMGDRSYTATWEANGYKVHFDANNGEGEMADMTFVYDATQALAANTFTRTGYTFEGWNTKADGSGTVYADKQEVTNLIAEHNAVVTLYAQWKAIVYTITYDLAGGTMATENPAEYTIESDAITLTNPTRKGYTFTGWTGTDIDGAVMTVTIAKGSMGDRTYTATWKLVGDVNGDQKVDVADITTIISVMSGNTEVSPASADVNNDGKVDMADITALIKMIAGQK